MRKAHHNGLNWHCSLFSLVIHAVLVPPRDPRAIATEVVRLLKSPEERKRLGTGARDRVLNRWNFDRAFTDTLAFLRDLLEEHPASEYG